MDSLEKALNHTLRNEGGFVDNPTDRGGATRYGITKWVARRAGYWGHMADLPMETAKAIYRAKYWEHRRLRLDPVAEWYESAALELFDTAVNMGVVRAAKFFQRALNALNRNQTLYPDLVVDGWAGAATMAAMGKLRTNVEKRVGVKMRDSLHGAFYSKIMQADTTQEKYARGWFDHRVGL